MAQLSKATSPCSVLVVCYLHRLATPLRAYLDAVFSAEFVGQLFPIFARPIVKVALVDSIRGVTADLVHVVRGRRFMDLPFSDQYFGIQSDTKREHICYTRGRMSTTVWLETSPFGTPGKPTVNHTLGTAISEGQEFAQQRVAAIRTVSGEWCELAKQRPSDLAANYATSPVHGTHALHEFRVSQFASALFGCVGGGHLLPTRDGCDRAHHYKATTICSGLAFRPSSDRDCTRNSFRAHSNRQSAIWGFI